MTQYYLDVEWEDAEYVSNLPMVDELIKGLLEDPTGDNATMLVREVMKQTIADLKNQEENEPLITVESSLRFKLECEQRKNANLLDEVRELKEALNKRDIDNKLMREKILKLEFDNMSLALSIEEWKRLYQNSKGTQNEHSK